MAEQTLFLAWHGAGENHLWFPVGRLDADVQTGDYRFRYTHGTKRAQKQAGYPLLMEYRDVERDYHSPELFPMFQNRVMSPSRPDFKSYLKSLDLDGDANPIEILAVNGGERVTDRYEVFPMPARQPDGSFLFRFFLHGWRYTSDAAQQRLGKLEPGEELRIALELNNPVTGQGVQIQNRRLPHDWLGAPLPGGRLCQSHGRRPWQVRRPRSKTEPAAHPFQATPPGQTTLPLGQTRTHVRPRLPAFG